MMGSALNRPSAGSQKWETERSRTVRKVVLPGQTPEGQHILSVLVKRTYNIQFGKRCVRADEDSAINTADKFYADPMNTSVQFESDFVPFKLATDMVFNGRAYAPGGAPASSLVAGLAVGAHKKIIYVTGDRVCHYRPNSSPVFGEPTPFATMDLRYERAYGGVDIYSDKRIPFPYMRNLLGCGFAVKNTEKTIQGLALPNIEDPENLLTPETLCCNDFRSWENQPMPAGLGWLPKTWLPRAQFAGVMPADRAVERELREAYTNLVPREHRELYAKTQLPAIDFRFFNGASSGLVLPFLKGDEMIRTANLTPEGQSTFYLPADVIKIGIDIGTGMIEPEIVLHTVMIRMEDKQIDLVWRAAASYPGTDWLPRIQKMDVLIQ
jgi:hypothetical protein